MLNMQVLQEVIISLMILNSLCLQPWDLSGLGGVEDELRGSSQLEKLSSSFSECNLNAIITSSI